MDKLVISFLPDQSQTLLLRAALWKGEKALESWAQWRGQVDFDSVDAGTLRLLPLLYRNLLAHGVQDSLMGKLKGIYRRTWYRNQLVFHRCCEVVSMLQEAGIHAILLKGPALVLQYYKDPGLRPMDDFDLLVMPHQAIQAMQKLEQSKWRLARKNLRSAEDQIPLRNSLDFVNDQQVIIDLHWNILNSAKNSANDDEFWNRALRIRFEQLDVLALDPEDQFFHICAHGARWNPMPPIRWIADAYTIAAGCERSLNWNRIYDLALRYDLPIAFREMLICLRDIFEVAVPDEIIERFKTLKITERQQREFEATLRPQRFWGFLPAIYNDYARRSQDLPKLQQMYGFLRYMQYEWDVPTMWHLPLHALHRRLSRNKKEPPQRN